LVAAPPRWVLSRPFQLLLRVKGIHASTKTVTEQMDAEFDAADAGLNPNSEAEPWDAKGARPSGRFNVHHACDLRLAKTIRALKRRERRAPAAWL